MVSCSWFRFRTGRKNCRNNRNNPVVFRRIDSHLRKDTLTSQDYHQESWTDSVKFLAYIYIYIYIYIFIYKAASDIQALLVNALRAQRLLNNNMKS